MLTQKNEEAIDMIAKKNIPQPTMTPALQELDNHWYSDIIFFLLHFTCPNHLVVRRMHTNSRNLMKAVSSLEKVGEVWPWGKAQSQVMSPTPSSSV